MASRRRLIPRTLGLRGTHDVQTLRVIATQTVGSQTKMCSVLSNIPSLTQSNAAFVMTTNRSFLMSTMRQNRPTTTENRNENHETNKYIHLTTRTQFSFLILASAGCRHHLDDISRILSMDFTPGRCLVVWAVFMVIREMTKDRFDGCYHACLVTYVATYGHTIIILNLVHCLFCQPILPMNSFSLRLSWCWNYLLAFILGHQFTESRAHSFLYVPNTIAFLDKDVTIGSGIKNTFMGSTIPIPNVCCVS